MKYLPGLKRLQIRALPLGGTKVDDELKSSAGLRLSRGSPDGSNSKSDEVVDEGELACRRRRCYRFSPGKSEFSEDSVSVRVLEFELQEFGVGDGECEELDD